MSRLVAFLRSLGTDGAVRNARLLLDDRRRDRALIAALAASRTPKPAPTRRTTASAA